MGYLFDQLMFKRITQKLGGREMITKKLKERHISSIASKLNKNTAFPGSASGK